MPELKPIHNDPLTRLLHYMRVLRAALSATIAWLLPRPGKRDWGILEAFRLSRHGQWGGNRWSDQFQQSLVRGLWTFFVDVQFNGAGAPTLAQSTIVNNSTSITWAAAGAKGTKWGALTFVRNGVGDYTLTFQDKWVRILNYSAMFMSSTNVAAPITQIKVASNPNAAGSTTGEGWTGASGSPSTNAVELLFFSAQGAVADPAATEMAVIQFQLMASTAN